MTKKLYLALMCLVSVVLFTACDGKKNNNPNKDGSWYTSASQIDVNAFDNKDNKCWAIDLWCDGTTIGRQYEWGSESAIAAEAKLILTLDYQTFGYQTKKVKWFEADANDADACHSLVWEGARCWEETISAGGQSETGYGWMPEANMKERHNYFENKGLHHEYKSADASDIDACDILNPEDTITVTPPTTDPKDYDKYDNTTSKCWKVVQESYGLSITTYVWMTERMLVETFDAAKVAYTYEQAAANDEDACAELQENNTPVEGEDACWKITSSVLGQSSVEYYWGTEAEAQAQVNAINSTGIGTASYTKAAANDPDSCEALEE